MKSIEVVVTPNGAIVRVVDGRIVAKQQFQLNHSSPIVDDGVVYATQDGSIKAVTLADVTAEKAVTNVAWETTGSRSSRLASPLYDHGLIYSVTEQGILDVTDAATGERGERHPAVGVVAAGGLDERNHAGLDQIVTLDVVGEPRRHPGDDVLHERHVAFDSVANLVVHQLRLSGHVCHLRPVTDRPVASWVTRPGRMSRSEGVGSSGPSARASR